MVTSADNRQQALAEICAPLGDCKGALREGLRVMRRTLAQQNQAVIHLLSEDQREARTLYGAFAARKLLEATMVAVLARLDPPRFLILYEYQQRQGSDYQLGTPHSVAFSWRDEVVGNKKDKTGNQLWETEVAPKEFLRALLCGHLAEVSWPAAIQQACDPDNGALGSPESNWLGELRDRYEKAVSSSASTTSHPSGWSVLCALRDRARSLYSELSKGVHVEFLVPEEIVFDAETVGQKLTETLKLCGQLGYLSNHIDTIATRLPSDQADHLLLLLEQSCDV